MHKYFPLKQNPLIEDGWVLGVLSLTHGQIITVSRHGTESVTFRDQESLIGTAKDFMRMPKHILAHHATILGGGWDELLEANAPISKILIDQGRYMPVAIKKEFQTEYKGKELRFVETEEGDFFIRLTSDKIQDGKRISYPMYFHPETLDFFMDSLNHIRRNYAN